MNNNRLCPSCRHPLPTNTCRKCGYKEKKLRIVDTQQEFARFSYLQKIRTSGQELPSVRRLTKQEKLSIYLRQYQSLLKKAASTLAEVKQLNIATSLQLKHQTKLIWQAFLLKKKDINSSIPGIFKKYLANHKPEPALERTNKKAQGQQAGTEHFSEGDQKLDQEEEVTGAKKRGRRGKSKPPKQLSSLTQFRCYYNNSVKPLIGESIEQRKLNQNQLTSVQKSYLSYLLGISQADVQLLKVAGYKYIKLLHSINNHKIQKSYIKQNQIASELAKRRLKLMKTKENSSLLVLLYDLLLCWALVTIHSDSLTLNQMMILYEKNTTRFQVVEVILKELDAQRVPQNPNVPQISYQLIYAIVYLASIRTGLTISVGEAITCIGRLQISRIQVEEDLYLQGVANQEVITSQRIRKQAHVLAHFLQLQFPCFISKWTQKWCQKLDLNSHLSMIELINRMLFKEAKEKYSKIIQDKNGYYRCYELDQDIASLAGVMVFLKLADGLTDYPYLVLSKPQDLFRQFTVRSSEINSLNQLLKNKQITVKEQSHSPVRKKIPQLYRQPVNMATFSKRISFLNQFDKQIGADNFNLNLVRLRNLANLNGVTTISLLEYFKKCEEERKQSQNKDQIKLRYTQIQHNQWVQKRLRDSKIPPIRFTNNQQKQLVELSDNLTNQIGCIISQYEKVVEDGATATVPCLIDEPSSNYELMYEYTSDYLLMVNRPQQLWVMEQLCFNNCSYSELTHWLTTYESVLKLYEIQ